LSEWNRLLGRVLPKRSGFPLQVVVRAAAKRFRTEAKHGFDPATRLKNRSVPGEADDRVRARLDEAVQEVSLLPDRKPPLERKADREAHDGHDAQQNRRGGLGRRRNDKPAGDAQEAERQKPENGPKRPGAEFNNDPNGCVREQDGKHTLVGEVIRHSRSRNPDHLDVHQAPHQWHVGPADRPGHIRHCEKPGEQARKAEVSPRRHGGIQFAPVQNTEGRNQDGPEEAYQAIELDSTLLVGGKRLVVRTET